MRSLTALVVDLSEVTFLDSYALGVVVQAAKKARARRVGFALAGVNGLMKKLFEITGLHRVIALHPDVEAAITTLSPTSPAGAVSPNGPAAARKSGTDTV